MLAPRTSSAFVCLRCQFRLARPTARSLVSYPAPSASFSSSTYRRYTEEGNGASAEPEIRPGVIHPLGRIRKRRGHRGNPLRETTAPLAVKTLGTDSEIIVLREVGDRSDRNRTETPRVVEVPKYDGTEKDRILESLNEGSVQLSQREINQQIETIRPQSTSSQDEPNYLTLSEFKRLNELLRDGFTTVQLTRYFSATTGVHRKELRKEVLQGLIQSSDKTGTHQTEWRPGTTPLAERLLGVEPPWMPRKGKGLKTGKGSVNKDQIVDQIIRKAWKVVLLEEIEATGELEITLKRWQLRLLNTGAKPTLLDRIQQQRNAKLEVYWPHNILRITGDKSSAEYAAQDIENFLSANIDIQRFDIRPWIPLLAEGEAPIGRTEQVISQKDLQTIEKLTGTAIQEAGGDMLIIRGLSKGQVDDARRYLISLLPLKPNYSRIVRTMAAEDDIEKVYIHPFIFTNSLNYRLRSLPLGRWCLPVNKGDPAAASANTLPADEIEPASIAKSGKATAALKDDLCDILADNEKTALSASESPKELWGTKSEDRAWWERRLQMDLSAEFGQGLFPIHEGNKFVPESITAENTPSVFSGVIPGLPKFIYWMRNAQDGGTSTDFQALYYQYLPAPQNADSDRSGLVYPSLTIQVLLRPDGSISLRGVVLNIKDHFVDVLIPNGPTDIRFKRSESLWMRNHLQHKSIQALNEAISANITSGERLTAPSTLCLPVPLRVIKGAKTSDPEKDLTEEVQYLFAGIEHCQFASSAFEGYPLRYTAVQAGQLASKEGRMELRYRKPLQEAHLEQDCVSHFIEAAFDVTKIIRDAASNPGQMEKLRRKESQRRSERAAAAAAAAAADAALSRLAVDDEAVGLEETGSTLSGIEVPAAEANGSDITPNAVENNENVKVAEEDGQGYYDPILASILSENVGDDVEGEGEKQTLKEESSL
ncbi:hypothetical protein GQ43DRAFT_482742 [Delitschia confertaspora ATCC 74209]|uniref:K Homology domain-containing protein n=1 Tax=Delitschia confertaspora ATCC 74209 TaxID=1513339 RepID=A0A9P4JGP5_9PLEO|nr:hypothetical protein GQ43DRAFT_482742 [Delitschia confertaspora ATCC 74209]